MVDALVVVPLADAATEVLSYAGTLLAGVLTGAVGGAVVTTSHERAERFRERMMIAATELLDAVDEFSGALYSYRGFLAETYDRLKDDEQSDFEKTLLMEHDAATLRERAVEALTPGVRKLTNAAHKWRSYSWKTMECQTPRVGLEISLIGNGSRSFLHFRLRTACHL
jgi:hypothetical protein